MRRKSLLLQVVDANGVRRFIQTSNITVIEPAQQEGLTEINLVGGKKVIVKEVIDKVVNSVRAKDKSSG
jgi:uncharacterized protein YlzI (FlbEa/FlbD family)